MKASISSVMAASRKRATPHPSSTQNPGLGRHKNSNDDDSTYTFSEGSEYGDELDESDSEYQEVASESSVVESDVSGDFESTPEEVDMAAKLTALKLKSRRFANIKAKDVVNSEEATNILMDGFVSTDDTTIDEFFVTTTGIEVKCKYEPKKYLVGDDEAEELTEKEILEEGRSVGLTDVKKVLDGQMLTYFFEFKGRQSTINIIVLYKAINPQPVPPREHLYKFVSYTVEKKAEDPQ